MGKDIRKGGAQGSDRLLGWGLGLGGAALLGLATMTIYGFVDAVARGAPIIIWDEAGWIALPIALAFLVLALALSMGRHVGSDGDGRRSNAIKYLLTLSVCLLPLVMVFPVGVHWFAVRHLEARGYKECLQGLWIAVDRVPEVPDTPTPCRGLSDKLPDHLSLTNA